MHNISSINLSTQFLLKKVSHKKNQLNELINDLFKLNKMQKKFAIDDTRTSTYCKTYNRFMKIFL